MVLLSVLVLAFATLVTTHLSLAVGLGGRRPRWRGAIALVVPPLALWWGWRAQMRVRAALWVAAAVVYGVALAMSMRG